MFWEERRGGMKPTVIAGLPERLPDIVSAGELEVTLVVIAGCNRGDLGGLLGGKKKRMRAIRCGTDGSQTVKSRRCWSTLAAARRIPHHSA